MSYIRISNESYFDKNHNETFSYQKEYKFFNVGDSLSTLVPMYKTLIEEALGEKVNETFRDFALSTSETNQIQTIFEREIKKELIAREFLTIKGFAERNIFGKTYYLDLKLNPNNDRMINDMHKLYLICEECLFKNKPMYLSIE